jgi:predicted DNA-binding transcriptional regulator AlpA
MSSVQSPEYLTAADVMARYSCGRMWIERRIKDSGFPKPVKFGPGVSAVRRWHRDQLLAWEHARESAA